MRHYSRISPVTFLYKKTAKAKVQSPSVRELLLYKFLFQHRTISPLLSYYLLRYVTILTSAITIIERLDDYGHQGELYYFPARTEKLSLSRSTDISRIHSICRT